MKWIAALSLLATAAVWAWAFTKPREPDRPFPEGLAGTFQLVRYEPPPGMPPMGNPFPPEQSVFYDMSDAGTYRWRKLLTAPGCEMTRIEGFLRHEEGKIVLDPELENGARTDAPEETYLWRWARDDQGELLVLRHDPDGFQLFLRPVRDG